MEKLQGKTKILQGFNTTYTGKRRTLNAYQSANIDLRQIRLGVPRGGQRSPPWRLTGPASGSKADLSGMVVCYTLFLIQLASDIHGSNLPVDPALPLGCGPDRERRR